MNLQKCQQRINELVSRFVAEIKGAAAMTRTDVNHVSESVLVPLFKAVYGYKNLRNLNQTDRSSFPAIDLADDDAQTAFQVTATAASTKIEETLRIFTDKGLHRRYKRLIIYILTERRRSYSGRGFQKYFKDGFTLDKNEDIRDYRHLLRTVEALPLDKAQQVLSILEEHFGETKPSGGVAKTSNDELIRTIERARIALDHFEMIDLAEGKRPRIAFKVINTGRTPATILEVLHQVGIEENIPVIPDFATDAISAGNIILQPSRDHNIVLGPIEMTPQMRAVLNNRHSVHLWGRINYRDVFGIIHQMGFGYTYDRAHNRFRIATNPAYNYDQVVVNGSTEASRLQERAWIFAARFVLEHEPSGTNPDVVITTYMRNSGRTPALEVSAKGILGIAPDPGPLPDWTRVATSLSGVSVPPGVNNYRFDSTTKNVPLRYIENYRSGEARIYIRAMINYHDVFGMAHWTQLCAFHSYGKDLNEFTLCERDNTIDDQTRKSVLTLEGERSQ